MLIKSAVQVLTTTIAKFLCLGNKASHNMNTEKFFLNVLGIIWERLAAMKGSGHPHLIIRRPIFKPNTEHRNSSICQVTRISGCPTNNFDACYKYACQLMHRGMIVCGRGCLYLYVICVMNSKCKMFKIYVIIVIE